MISRSFVRICAALSGVFSVVILFADSPSDTNSSTSSIKRSASRGRHSAKPRVKADDANYGMSLTYYSVRGQLHTTLTLNNKGGQEIDPKITLYGRDGRRHTFEQYSINPRSFLELDLRDLVALAGQGFEDGSMRITYLGQKMALGGMLRMTNAELGHEFDEQLMYPVAEASNRLDAVWWLPDETTEGRVVVTNVTGATVTADIRIDGTDAALDSTVVTLKPWELTVVDLAAIARRIKVAGNAPSRFGGVSITYTGQPGAILARGFVANSRRFSTVISFSDRASARTTAVEGAGVRVSLPDGARLTPLILARNASRNPTRLSGRLQVSLDGEQLQTIDFAETHLRPGQTVALDATDAWTTAAQLGRPATNGVEFTYDGDPGSVQLLVMSLSADQEQAFRVPMHDIEAIPSATGMYFWRQDGTRSSVVFIKNPTDRTQHYNMAIRWENGQWAPGLQKVPPRHTVMIDIRALQAARVPDLKGRRIPEGVDGGQLNWSLVGGVSPKDLVGRMEQVDHIAGVSSTYACPAPVVDNYDRSYIEPEYGAEIMAGEDVGFTVWEIDRDAMGIELEPYVINDILSWQSMNPSVASSLGNGWFLGHKEGLAVVHVSGESHGWQEYQGEGDPGDHVPISYYVDLQVACAFPTNFRLVGTVDDDNPVEGALRYEFAWDSTIGTTANLFNNRQQCRIGELVNYPGGNPYSFPWPYPDVSISNPFLKIDPAHEGQGTDIHWPGNPENQTFRPPFDGGTYEFTATQNYGFVCSCQPEGTSVFRAYSNFTNIQIRRRFEPHDLDVWVYRIFKWNDQADRWFEMSAPAWGPWRPTAFQTPIFTERAR